jgi:hypothetical protein
MADARLLVVVVLLDRQIGAEVVRGLGLADPADVVALALDRRRILHCARSTF